MEHAASPDISTSLIQDTPQTTGQPTPQLYNQPPAVEVRSADPLKLTITEEPFSEAALIGSGTMTDADWLEY